MISTPQWHSIINIYLVYTCNSRFVVAKNRSKWSHSHGVQRGGILSSWACMSSTEGKEMVGGGLKLFGVQLETPTSPMNKTLNFATDESSSSPFSACSLLKNETREKISKGNMSDGMAVKTQERKKGK